jgi:hypothetical protein
MPTDTFRLMLQIAKPIGEKEESPHESFIRAGFLGELSGLAFRPFTVLLVGRRLE